MTLTAAQVSTTVPERAAGTLRERLRAVERRRRLQTFGLTVPLLLFIVVTFLLPIVFFSNDDAIYNSLVAILAIIAIEVAAATNFWLKRSAVVACSLIGAPLAVILLLKADPVNVLGRTKRMAERLTRAVDAAVSTLAPCGLRRLVPGEVTVGDTCAAQLSLYTLALFETGTPRPRRSSTAASQSSA